MRITNTPSQQAVYQTNQARQGLTDSLERVSSGKRINSASDDASGMVIAGRLKRQSDAFGQASKNASDGIAITQIADGSLGQMTEILQAVRTKVVEAASGSQSADSREAIQADINGQLQAMDDLAGSVRFNGQPLLTGAFSGKTFFMGQGQTIDISIPGMDTSRLGSQEKGMLANIDVTTAQGAQDALDVVDAALDQVSQTRSGLGATQNQFSSGIEGLETGRISLMAAHSQIMDVDLAEESMVMNQMETLEKASIFALKKANMSKSHLIDLLG